MDAKLTHRLRLAERRIQFAERFADHDRYLAFHPNALRRCGSLSQQDTFSRLKARLD